MEVERAEGIKRARACRKTRGGGACGASRRPCLCLTQFTTPTHYVVGSACMGLLRGGEANSESIWAHVTALPASSGIFWLMTDLMAAHDAD